MNIEDRIRSSLARTANDVAPPAIDAKGVRGPALRQRRRTHIAVAATAVAGLALVGYAAGSGFDRSDSANPTGRLGDVRQTLRHSDGLDPGRYSVQVEGQPMRARVTLGEGWHRSGSQIFTGSATIQFWAVGAVYKNACDLWSGATRLHNPSVADVTTALDRQAGTDLTAAQDVRPGGFAGVRAALRPSRGVDPSSCTDQSLFLWNVADYLNHRGRYTTHDEMVWILDANGTTVVVDAQYDLADSAQAESIAKIVGSIRFAAVK